MAAHARDLLYFKYYKDTEGGLKDKAEELLKDEKGKNPGKIHYFISASKNAIHPGSFLARGEESLVRFSIITKQNSDQAIVRPMNSRNLVFAHLSPTIEVPIESEAELNGQKNTRTADSKFRKRKPPTSLTPVSSKKSKKEYEHSDTRSRLFD